METLWVEGSPTNACHHETNYLWLCRYDSVNVGTRVFIDEPATWPIFHLSFPFFPELSSPLHLPNSPNSTTEVNR